MKKLAIITIIIALVSVLFFVTLRIRSGGPNYIEIHPERGSIKVEFRQTGSISPKNRLEIRSPVPGRIEDILVNEGQKVKKGIIIAWVSSSERASMLDAARARGIQEYKKWEDIYRPTPIIAPLDGFIIARKNEPGQTISQTDAFLVMADKLIIEAYVDETDLRYIKIGQEVKIILDAYPDQKYNGIVEQIAYESQDINNVTVYKVKILPIETPPVFRSGMTASVLVYSEPKNNIIILPFDSVKDKNGKKYVLLKRGDSEPEERFIETGISNDKSVEIIAGVTESDTVLIETNRPKKKKVQALRLPGLGGGRR
ncbi:MAG: HlyD family efflux transporter periplasmic adaptor subunit [Elusimicrobia bacterium]|nr:HlyD family efflux transporter periplasmic adaptor subunit [Elusimicrobiota bacterium]